MDPLLILLKQMERTQWEKPNMAVPQKPILTRYHLQTMVVQPLRFRAQTSGSVGVPVVVQKTDLSQLWWNATNVREALWFKRDLTLPFAAIRMSINRAVSYATWGSSFELLGPTGPSYGHPLNGDLNQWLQRIKPGYLMTYPSVLETIDLAALPSLKGVKTTGETTRQKHPLIADTYSAEEVGTIAIQCPDNGDVYHVMENILVEILDENDKPTECGRVIVTDRTSHYIHRYEIGDYAEIGHCHCGRGLQTIRKILGRKRNRMIKPDGSLFWPRFGSSAFRDIAPIQRYQFVQKNRETLELRLQIDNPLNEPQQDALQRLIQNALDYPFTIHYVYTHVFPEGKLEPFLCEAT